MTSHAKNEHTPTPKWYVHRFRDLYSPHVSTEIRVERQGTVYARWVHAVCEPYTAGSLFAAWEVLRGRAFAFEWPKPGDLEAITDPPNPTMGREELAVGS